MDPFLAWLATRGVTSDDRARVLIPAISGQESGFKERRQIGGPARGWWQFEPGPMSGRAEVLTGPVTKRLAAQVCTELDVPADRITVCEALEQNDLLACASARVLVGHPAPLPGVDQPEAGWDYYVSRSHPGEPDRARWAPAWRAATEAVAARSGAGAV